MNTEVGGSRTLKSLNNLITATLVCVVLGALAWVAAYLLSFEILYAVAGLFADGETIVQDAACIRESYPGFETALEEFVNPKRSRGTTPVIGSLSPARIDQE